MRFGFKLFRFYFFQTLGLESTVGWERGDLGDHHVRVLLKMLTSNFAPNWYVLPSKSREQVLTHIIFKNLLQLRIPGRSSRLP